MTFNHRDRERGAIAVMIAVMWTALFGMAVVAVDFGYIYTKKRGMQAAADGALKASMPIFQASGRTPAETRARAVLQLDNKFASSEIDFPTAPANRFTVRVQRTQPTFFGGLFGIGPKTLQGVATGELLSASAGPAIHAINPAPCNVVWVPQGIEVTGNGKLLVQGDMESMGHVHIGNLDVTCDPSTTCRVTGSTKSNCPGPTVPDSISNDDPAHFGMPTELYSTPTPDPLAANGLPFWQMPGRCTHGTSMTTTLTNATIPWIPCVGGDSLPANAVLCSDSAIILNPPDGPDVCPSIATFASQGVVQINTGGTVTLTAAANTNNIVIFSNFIGGGNAVFLTNGPTFQYNLTGHVYAPRGLVRAGSQSPGVTLAGMIVGFDVLFNLGNLSTWIVGNGSVGPSTGWRVYR